MSCAKGTGPSKVVPDGAYRLRSNQPVTVYQYNPLNADVSNDASLMLPVNAWTGDYVVASWPHWAANVPGLLLGDGPDDTTVTLAPSAPGARCRRAAGSTAEGNGVVVLNEGDVLQVMTGNGGDLTGTLCRRISRCR
jgi:hypothetical protein